METVSTPMGYHRIGEKRPEGWEPKLTLSAMIKLVVDGDNYPEFVFSGDLGRPESIMVSAQQENGGNGLQPVALSGSKSKLDLMVIADCWFVIHLDKRTFQGWLTDEPAIMTKEKHSDKYFELFYLDEASGAWVTWAEAQSKQLLTHAIRFGAQLLSTRQTEAHKFSFNFMFSKMPNYHDPDIRNPVIP